MAQYIRLDEQDRAALRALADFVISDDSEVAVAAGKMEVEIDRPGGDDAPHLRLRIRFPNDEKLDVWLSRDMYAEEKVENLRFKWRERHRQHPAAAVDAAAR